MIELFVILKQNHLKNVVQQWYHNLGIKIRQTLDVTFNLNTSLISFVVIKLS